MVFWKRKPSANTYRHPLPNAELRDSLRSFVCSPAMLPVEAADGAPEILPGLVVAVALEAGGRIDFLPRESIEALGGGSEIRALATRNLRNLGPPRLETMEGTTGRQDSTVTILRYPDLFGASRISDLQSLLASNFGIAPSRGVVVAIPEWRVVLVHLPSGAGILTALPLMAQLAYGLNDMAPEQMRLSPDVYFIAPDGRSQVVGQAAAGKGVRVETRGLISDTLFGPNGIASVDDLEAVAMQGYSVKVERH